MGSACPPALRWDGGLVVWACGLLTSLLCAATRAILPQPAPSYSPWVPLSTCLPPPLAYPRRSSGTYKVLAPFIAPHIRPHSRVLVVGCGNSTLSADLAAAHPTVSIISTDYSPVVVEAMAAAHPAATYAVGDVRGMGDLFPAPAAFDVIVDKGVMDALVADEASPWSPAPTAVADARAMTAEMRRLLVPGGVFLQVTFHQPHFRLRNYLESDGWAVRPHQVVPVGLGYFFFVCVRDDEREVAEPVAAPVTAIDGGGRGGGTVGGGGG